MYSMPTLQVGSMDDPVSSGAAGRWLKAPEGFVSGAAVAVVAAEARRGRRDFIRGAFAAALAGGATAARAQTNPVPSAGGDPNILELPEHSTRPRPAGGHATATASPRSTSATCSAARAPA